LQQQLNCTMQNALMCPKCKYGPIEHVACSDLASHHDQQVSGGAKIDNRCPNENCRFFSKSASGWEKWDGILRDVQTARARATPDASQSGEDPDLFDAGWEAALAYPGAPVATLSPLTSTSRSNHSRSGLPAEQSRDDSQQVVTVTDGTVTLEEATSIHCNSSEETDERITACVLIATQCEYSRAVEAVRIARQHAGVRALAEEVFELALRQGGALSAFDDLQHDGTQPWMQQRRAEVSMV
jgi:hypothetical protein